MVAVGDTVIYCKEDYVGRVDQYEARVRAVNEDGSLDLLVLNYYGTAHNTNEVRYDPDGKPSSWHLKEK